MMFTLLLLSNIFFNVFSLDCPAQIRNHQPKIAIIGANTAGLFLAEQLARISGICPQNIVIYEKDTTPEYLSKSKESPNDGMFDLGPIVLPSYTYRKSYDEDHNLVVDTQPFYSPLYSYIKKAKAHYVSGDGHYWKDSNKTNGLGTPWLRPQETLNSNRFIQEMGELLILMESLQDMHSIQAIYDADFAYIGETTYDWFYRHNYTVAGQFLTWCYDALFDGAPSHYMSAARFWYIWDIIGLPFMANVLIDAGIDPSVPSFDDYPWLRAVLENTQSDDTRTWRITNGTQIVFDALVEQLEAWGVTVCMNETVVQIEYSDYRRDNDDPRYRRLSENDGYYNDYDHTHHDSSSHFANPYRSSSWSSNSDLPRHTSRRHKPMRIYSNNWGERYYDFVINTARVHETINILKHQDFPVLYYLFGQVTTNPPNYAGVFEYTPSNNDPSWIDDINNNGPVFVFPQSNTLGTSQAYKFWAGDYECYPYSIERRDDSIKVHAYIDGDHVDYCNNHIIDILSSDHFNLTDVQVWGDDSNCYFMYPDTIPVNEEYNGWYEAIKSLQGYHGLYNFNEAVTGETIYAQIKYMMQNTQMISDSIWDEFDKRMDAMHKCDYKKKDLPVYMEDPDKAHKKHAGIKRNNKYSHN